MNLKPSISAVVTYHESSGTIARVLEALLRQEPPLIQIVVVDNGSSPPLELTAAMEQHIQRLQLEPSMGLPAARNAGLAAVSSDLVLILDDDVYLTAGCLERLVAAILETQAAAVAPRLVFHPGDSIIQCDGASIHFSGMLSLNNQDTRLESASAQRLRCAAFIGACVLFRRPLLASLGGFDEDYEFYYEDLELSYRLGALGHAIWCEPTAVALHDRGAGTPGLSFRSSGQYPSRRAFLTLRHRWLTILLHYQNRTQLLLAPALAAYELAAFAECVRRGWLAMWVKACGSLLRQARSIAERRRRWGAMRRVNDSELLSGGPLPFATGFLRTVGEARAAGLLSQALNFHWRMVQRWL